MKKINIFYLILIPVCLFTSCNNPSQEKKEDTQGVISLVHNKEAEKQTFRFELSESAETDSSIVYRAISLFEEDTVGLEIEVLKFITAGVTYEGHVDEENGFKKGTIRFRTLGEESDNYVESVSGLFKEESSGQMTEETLEPLVFSSNNQDIELPQSGTFSFKLFFDNSYGAEAEMFAVLDTHQSVFELSEKDEVFRKNFLSALTGEE